MASAQQFLTLESADDVETFFLLLESKFCIEKVEKDEEKVLRLVSLVGLEALKKVRQICLPKKITELQYKEVKEKIFGYVKPRTKLVWAERTKFFNLKQDAHENIMQYVTKLRNQASSCDFETLKQSSNIQESLVVHQLICGINSKEQQGMILQSAAIKTPTVSSITDLVESLDQINSFCGRNKEMEVMAVRTTHTKKNSSQSFGRKCSFCGNPWHKSLSQCPARKLTCRNCGSTGLFSKCCKRPRHKEQNSLPKQHNINTISGVFHVQEANFIEKQFEIIQINSYPVKFV